MDEAYRLFFEDVDWSFRVSNLGLRLMVYPGVRVKHTGGRSFTPDQECWIAARYCISMVVFFRRYRGLFRALLVAAVILVNAGAVIVANVVFRPFVRPSVRNTLCRHAAKQASIVKHFYRRWVRNEELELPLK
jgi:GT2 family glycosyltransferase